MKALKGNKKTSDDIISEVIKNNPKKEPLTIERLKTFKGFENKSDEELKVSLAAIKEMATVIIEFIRTEKTNEIELTNINNKAA